MPSIHMEFDRFRKLFPEMSTFVANYRIDSKRPHAIKIVMKSGQELYFDCDAKSEVRFTLTTDPEIIDKMRGSRY